MLCGVQSSDAVNGATGIALAGFLDLPHVAVVKSLDYDAASSTATVERELEGGLVEVLRVRTPALLTIQTGINQPRYATLRAIKQAREKPLAVEGLAALGLDASDARERRRIAPAHARDARPHGRRGDDRRLARRGRGAHRRDRRGARGLMAGVLVLAEARRGELREVSLELITAAAAVRDAAGGRVVVALIDADAASHAAALAADGVDEVLAVAVPGGELRGAHRRARSRGADRGRAAGARAGRAHDRLDGLRARGRGARAPGLRQRRGRSRRGMAVRSPVAVPTATSSSTSSSSPARSARC